MEPGDERQIRAERNQSLFRDVNERIREMAETFEQLTPYGTWICECLNPDCAAPLEMALGEYEALREQPTHFAVAPSDEHVDPSVEIRVDASDRYWVVEKINVAGKKAKELDAV